LLLWRACRGRWEEERHGTRATRPTVAVARELPTLLRVNARDSLWSSDSSGRIARLAQDLRTSLGPENLGHTRRGGGHLAQRLAGAASRAHTRCVCRRGPSRRWASPGLGLERTARWRPTSRSPRSSAALARAADARPGTNPRARRPAPTRYRSSPSRPAEASSAGATSTRPSVLERPARSGRPDRKLRQLEGVTHSGSCVSAGSGGRRRTRGGQLTSVSQSCIGGSGRAHVKSA